MRNRRTAMAAGLTASGLAILNRAAAQGTTSRVRVLATTDAPLIAPLVEDFERRHRDLRVDYVQMGSAELFDRLASGGGDEADVGWSSAMDLQIKLVNDGFAAPYASPQAPALPAWAIWKHEAYGTTCEPVGMVAHRSVFDAMAAPVSHAGLAAMLQTNVDRFADRVVTYDVDRSGLGFLFAANDFIASGHSQDLVQALGRCRARLHAETRTMLKEVASGKALLAYNVLATYADAFAAGHPDVQVRYFDDYTLVVTRVALIRRNAPNPRGARAWLDHLLSARGQELLARFAGLYGVRLDSTPPRSALTLQRELGPAARPIALGPGLLAHLDRSKREALLRRWHRAFGA